VQEAEANVQRKSIMSELRAAALTCEFEQVNFVVGNCRSVAESDFYTKLKKLDLQEGKKDKFFTDCLKQVCETYDRVILSLLQHRPKTEKSHSNHHERLVC